MGNQLAVDKEPSSLDSLVSFSKNLLPENEVFISNSNFQHLNIWSLSEEKDPKTSRREEGNQFYTKPIDLSNMEKNHFLLDSQNVYIVLLIFKKEFQSVIDQSPFPTGLWGIIESSSNMTPRGLLYAFPVTNDSQNLESFLLSKRDYDDSEFKYMLFIWNGKSSSALLRSHSLMRAFDLDKALSEPEIIPFLFHGYQIKEKEIIKKGTVKLGDIINQTVEGEGNTPSSEKINNFHETVFLLKWLYPENTSSNNGNKNNKEKKPKKQKIFFKGFNKNFIKSKRKKSFQNNFKAVDMPIFNFSTSPVPAIGGINNGGNQLSNQPTSGVGNSANNQQEKIKPLDKDKLKLNLNLGDKMPNKNATNNMIPPKLNFNLNLGKKEEETKNCEYEGEDYEQDENFDDDENEDYDDINIDLNTNISASVSSAIPRMNNSNIPKLTVSLKQNVLNNEEINEKSKKKAKEEDALNEIPKITLVETTDKIISQQQQAQGEKEKKEIDALNEDYNLKDGERKKLISEYYSKHLSEILPEFLYLSSYNAAKNKDLLEKNRITHIINCAQDYCENCFEKESNIQYLSLYLKDHALENVECTFYECIEFIEMVKQKEGRVLVHCIQGISRSVSIVIAYLIYKNKMTYDQAFNFVQSKRTISCPNFGFSIQLQNFYLRLFEAPEKYRFNPKIFAVGSFQLEQSEKIVCRLMNENFFKERESKDPRVFDKRGIFIIIGTNYLYIWIGKKVSPKMKTLYISAAEKYISLLRKYEHVSNKQIIYINEDEETEEFLINLLKSEESIKKFKGKMSNEYSEWNNWYKEVEPKSQNSNIKKEEEESKGQGGEVLKAFFLYPELNPDKILDLEDLNDNLFLIACVKDPNEDKKTIFKWKGTGVELTEDECIEFQNKVTEKFFGSKNTEGINIIEEVPMEESEEFVALL